MRIPTLRPAPRQRRAAVRTWLQGLLSALAVIAFVAPLAMWSPAAPVPNAQAFSLDVHEGIVARTMVGRVDTDALNSIIFGNETSDAHQFAPERHFDSANGPAAICDRWRQGVRQYLLDAIQNSGPGNRLATRLVDREEALSLFGQMTHALQDFYSHSNWIELQLAAGASPGQAPIVSLGCNPADLPPDLQTGYFSLGDGLDGCPGTAFGGDPEPPAGFTYCHEQIAKDKPDEGHGAEVAPDGRTYHQIAVALAEQATLSAWELLHQQIVSTWTNSTTSGECLFQKLAFGGEEPCRCPSGSLPPAATFAHLPAAPAALADEGELISARIPFGQESGPVCTGTGSITFERVSRQESEVVTPYPNGSTTTDHDRASFTQRISVTLEGDRAHATVTEESVKDIGTVTVSKECTTTYRLVVSSSGSGSGEAYVRVFMAEDYYRIYVRAPRMQRHTETAETIDASGCPDAGAVEQMTGVKFGTTTYSSDDEVDSPPIDIDQDAEIDRENPPETLSGSQKLESPNGTGSVLTTWSVTAGNYETTTGRGGFNQPDDSFEDEGD